MSFFNIERSNEVARRKTTMGFKTTMGLQEGKLQWACKKESNNELAISSHSGLEGMTAVYV